MGKSRTLARKKSLPVTVDKSHLITIGEKLYAQSIELIRELVNNAYDADATEVKIFISDEAIRVEDNGTGMNLDGLKQYFAIGSPEKIINPVSPKFKRHRIGQFGIGKFATLSACSRFEIYTQTKDFAARVLFDKKEWEKNSEKWDLPLEVLPPDPKRGDGTTVVLSNLTKRFDPQEVERRLVESVPLKAENFIVYLNGQKVRPKILPGHKIPILEGTKYGIVHGEITILPASQASIEDLGVECKVKQVTVKREFFGMEAWGKEVARIRGEINADFLPITSDRTNFITDSDEYKVFDKKMREVMKEVRKAAEIMSSKKENKKARAALKDALEKVQRALSLNPDFSPFGALPLSDETSGIGGAAAVSSPQEKEDTREVGKPKKEVQHREETKKKKPMVKRLTPNAVIRKIKMGNLGVTCCLDYFGSDGPESFTEGTVIYVNRDHPLYQRQVKKRDAYTMHLARLLTQEISLMKDPLDPRQAYARQSKLLRDAFLD